MKQIPQNKRSHFFFSSSTHIYSCFTITITAYHRSSVSCSSLNSTYFALSLSERSLEYFSKNTSLPPNGRANSMTPTQTNTMQKPTGMAQASTLSSRKQEKSSTEKTTKNPTRKKTTKKALNPESVKIVQDLLERELGMTIQEGKFYIFGSSVLLANLKQL